MKYTKPEAITCGSAFGTIQGTSSANKGVNSFPDHTLPGTPDNAFTMNAYEADE